MYYNNDPEIRAQLENERILKMIAANPAEACASDPEARAAFEAALRQLAEDILTHSPSLAHLLLGMSSSTDPSIESFHGQN